MTPAIRARYQRAMANLLAEAALENPAAPAAVEPPQSPQDGAAAVQTGARRRRSTPRPAASAEVR